jgi:myo-inositol-1(or 4)-monophosphatase
MEKSETIAAMIEAAQRAGAGIMEDRERLHTLEIHDKAGPADLVSEADLRAEDTVRSILRGFRPEYGFLGEESGLEQGTDKAHVWIVDPLDGTTNFLTGSPLFAVNIALVRDGKAIAGVTYVPALDELFRAEQGAGAWLNDRRITVSKNATLGEAVLAVGIPFASKPRHEQFHAEMVRLTPKIRGIRRLGAGAVDMAWVACGRFEAYWEQSVSPWDMAAGTIIVQEAGGLVTDTAGGELDFDGGTVLACNGALLQRLLLPELRPV